MEALLLNKSERRLMNKTIFNLENSFGCDYCYVPETKFAPCTCQGNCDGPTGGATCQWG